MWGREEPFAKGSSLPHTPFLLLKLLVRYAEEAGGDGEDWGIVDASDYLEH
jgi:hypothetical protein